MGGDGNGLGDDSALGDDSGVVTDSGNVHDSGNAHDSGFVTDNGSKHTLLSPLPWHTTSGPFYFHPILGTESAACSLLLVCPWRKRISIEWALGLGLVIRWELQMSSCPTALPYSIAITLILIAILLRQQARYSRTTSPCDITFLRE